MQLPQIPSSFLGPIQRQFHVLVYYLHYFLIVTYVPYTYADVHYYQNSTYLVWIGSSYCKGSWLDLQWQKIISITEDD